MWLTLDTTVADPRAVGTAHLCHTLEHRGCVAFLTLFKLFSTFLLRINRFGVPGGGFNPFFLLDDSAGGPGGSPGPLLLQSLLFSP